MCRSWPPTLWERSHNASPFAMSNERERIMITRTASITRNRSGPGDPGEHPALRFSGSLSDQLQLRSASWGSGRFVGCLRPAAVVRAFMQAASRRPGCVPSGTEFAEAVFCGPRRGRVKLADLDTVGLGEGGGEGG